MKVLALTRYDRLGASSRLRIFQYLEPLRALGIEVITSPLLGDAYLERLYLGRRVDVPALFRDYLRRFIELWRARKVDFLWIEKELFPSLPAWFEESLKAFGIRYVVDYDDAVFHNYDLSANAMKRLLADKIDRVMQNSSVVIAGNDYLAERASAAGARRVEIIPTVIDLERYVPVRPRSPEVVTVGWMGSPSTVKYLNLVAPALESVAAEVPLRLRVLGASFKATGLEVECRPWTEASETEEIQDLDIGIMPLLDSPWERGKCGYKLIQYMACALPVIASPVGVNQTIVTHSQNGYLASSFEEWIQAIRSLCLNEGLRHTMGINGRAVVESKYCLQQTVNHLARIFYETCEER
ncbi:D-inositol-3-phosphate glycosyltransferase [compost metagenome]